MHDEISQKLFSIQRDYFHPVRLVDDGWTDEPNETRGTFDGTLSAIYPETGIHFWWTPRARLTGFARYLVTTDGRANDAWYFGFSVAVLSK